AHVDMDLAARPRVQFAARIGEAVRAPPPRHVFGIGPQLENGAARRVEHARERQFTFGGRLAGGCCHQALVFNKYGSRWRSSRSARFEWLSASPSPWGCRAPPDAQRGSSQ